MLIYLACIVLLKKAGGTRKDLNMDKSEKEKKAAAFGNQMNPAMVTGDDPVEMMLDVLFKMVEAFAQGVREGYSGKSKKPGAAQAEDTQKMMGSINQTMQTIQQMMLTQQQMQGQQMAQANPLQNGGQAKAQALQNGGQAQKAAKPEGVRKGDADNAGQPEKGAKQKNVKSEKTDKDKTGQVQQGQKKPDDYMEIMKQTVKKTGGMKWFSDAELDKAIESMDKLRNSNGKLNQDEEKFRKRLVELKKTMKERPNGLYSAEYVKLYDAAYGFSIKDQKNAKNKDAAKEAVAHADLILNRLRENQRIKTLRDTAPYIEKMEKKYGKDYWKDSRFIEKAEKRKEKQAAEERKLRAEVNSEVGKARAYMKKEQQAKKKARVL